MQLGNQKDISNEVKDCLRILSEIFMENRPMQKDTKRKPKFVSRRNNQGTRNPIAKQEQATYYKSILRILMHTNPWKHWFLKGK